MTRYDLAMYLLEDKDKLNEPIEIVSTGALPLKTKSPKCKDGWTKLNFNNDATIPSSEKSVLFAKLIDKDKKRWFYTIGNLDITFCNSYFISTPITSVENYRRATTCIDSDNTWWKDITSPYDIVKEE